MLTKAVPSPAYDEDKALLATLGMTMRPPFADGSEKQQSTFTRSDGTGSQTPACHPACQQ
jgi:hypothetical protein